MATRIVNVFPSVNTTVKLPHLTITAPIFNATLSNTDIYSCITQKATIFEVLANRSTVKITLGNIKKDLEAEEAALAAAKKNEIDQLEDEIDDLNDTIVSLKNNNIFESMAAAQTYTNSPTTLAGEIVSILVNGAYSAYIINTDKSLSPVGDLADPYISVVS
jgi:hypothetical protein